MIPYDATAASLFIPYMDTNVYLKHTNKVTSGDCAELSRLVYVLFEKTPAEETRFKNLLSTHSYDLIKFFDVGSTQAMTVRHKQSQEYVVVFRGSQITWNDIKTDLTILPTPWPHGGYVHKGFSDEFHSIWDAIKGACGDKLNTAFFTGHSLGAAIATLAANEIKYRLPLGQGKPKLITFGSPAIGDTGFVASSTGFLIERHVNCCDLVPRLPPEIIGFEHVGNKIYYDSCGLQNTDTSLQQFQDRMTARINFVASYALTLGAVKLRDLADHAPINYVRLFY